MEPMAMTPEELAFKLGEMDAKLDIGINHLVGQEQRLEHLSTGVDMANDRLDAYDGVIRRYRRAAAFLATGISGAVALIISSWETIIGLVS
jgi:hypothetical protein